MIGRQVIPTSRAFTLEELEQFMQQHWNREEYNDFFIGKPTPASVEKYVLLPATQRYMVIAYSRKGGSLLSKGDKVILSVCDAPAGIRNRLLSSVPSHSVFFGIWKISQTLSTEKERKGPAEDALQKYAAYMRQLLAQAGYAK